MRLIEWVTLEVLFSHLRYTFREFWVPFVLTIKFSLCFALGLYIVSTFLSKISPITFSRSNCHEITLRLKI
jgi:hypothetical protein